MLLKIAAIESHPTSKRGGSEKAFYEVLTGLKNLGHEVSLFYSTSGDLLLNYQEQGINCIKIPPIELKYFKLINWKHIYRSAVIIKSLKADCIYINQLGDAPLAALVKLLAGKIKIICHLRVPKSGISKIFNFCGQFIDLFITVNQLIKKEYENIFKADSIVVINDGIAIPHFLNPIKKERNKTAVYLGRISPEKGIGNLLNTWQILREKHHLAISLSITGPAVSAQELAFKKYIETEIQRLDLSDLIQIHEPIKDGMTYFSQFDFSVFPSTWAEPFGRTLPESILAGVPVFARNVGIVSEILAPEKEKLIFNTEEELAFQIKEFYSKGLSINIDALQQHIIQHYDVQKNVLLISKNLAKVALA